MKVVQTQVTETEYALLAAYARSRKTTIKDAMRDAIRAVAMRDSVDPDDFARPALYWDQEELNPHRAAVAPQS